MTVTKSKALRNAAKAESKVTDLTAEVAELRAAITQADADMHSVQQLSAQRFHAQVTAQVEVRRLTAEVAELRREIAELRDHARVLTDRLIDRKETA